MYIEMVVQMTTYCIATFKPYNLTKKLKERKGT